MSSTPWENEEKRNFIYMENIVSVVVSDGLRTIFKQEWNSRYQAKLGAWDDTSVSGQQLHKLEQTRKRPNRNVYLSHFLHGDTSKWDCSVLFDAIQYSKSIGSASLNPTIKSEVDNLRKIRNNVIHDLGGRLSDDDFQAMTTDVENAFKALGLPTKEITRIKAERNRYKPFQVLPPNPAHDVILRTEAIREISEDLKHLRSADKLTYFYISGNPGSGKSQLASQVCENIWQGVNRCEELTFVMTLDGKDVDSLLNSYEGFARRLNCNESVLLNVLSSTKTTEEKIKDLRSLITTRIKNWKRWWLVVDNVESLEVISPFLPQASDDVWNHGQIIVTTQNRNHVPPDSLLTKHVSISRGMSDLESHRILFSLSGCADSDPLLDKVAHKLDRQPLAMAAAAVYFKRVTESPSEFSWHDYLRKLENGKRQITEEQLHKRNPAYTSTMTAAVLLAVKKCTETDSNLKHAFQFLSFVSFEAMPLDLYVKYIQLADENFDREEVFLAIEQCSLFLPAENEDRDIRLHRVVHEVIKLNCESSRKAEVAHLSEARGGARELNDVKCPFQNVVHTLYSFVDRSDEEKLIPHLKAFNEVLKKLYPDHEQFYQDGSVIDRYQMLGMFMHFAGTLQKYYKYKCSLDFLYSSLQMSQALEDEFWVAEVYSGLGSVHQDMCELKEAKDYHQKALEIHKQKLGEKHIEVANSYNSLGLVFEIAGEYEEAKDYHQRAVEIKKEQLGEKNFELSSSYNNLGNVHQITGEYEKAKDYHQRALEIRKEELGELHIDVAASYNNLGEVCRLTAKMEKAKDYHQRALEIRKQQLGEKHVDVAGSYNNLGAVYLDTGDKEEARRYFHRACEILEGLLGEKNVHVAASYNNLGEVYVEIDEMERAKHYHQQALKIRKQLLGEKHVDVATSYTNLGNLYTGTGEYQHAKDNHQRALEIRKDRLGEKHVDVAASYIKCCEVYRHTGEVVQAKEYFGKGREIFIEQLLCGDSSFNTALLFCQLRSENEKANGIFSNEH